MLLVDGWGSAWRQSDKSSGRGCCFSSTAEPAAVPFAQDPGALSVGEEHPGAAAPWLPGDGFSSC